MFFLPKGPRWDDTLGVSPLISGRGRGRGPCMIAAGNAGTRVFIQYPVYSKQVVVPFVVQTCFLAIGRARHQKR